MKKATNKIEDILVAITFAEEAGDKYVKGWVRSGLENMDRVFAAAAFAEEGEFDTARALLAEGSGNPQCKEGYRYDETSRLCIAA